MTNKHPPCWEAILYDRNRSLSDPGLFDPGNHEAWIRGEKKGNTPAKDSFEKLERIHEICKDG